MENWDVWDDDCMVLKFYRFNEENKGKRSLDIRSLTFFKINKLMNINTIEGIQSA